MKLTELAGCNSICKACHYKDLEYPEQLARKNAWAQAQLGTWGEALQPLKEAPPGERVGYRSKSWLRAHVTDGCVQFGMFRAVRNAGKLASKWSEEFVSWDRCPLHVAGLQEVLARVAPALAQYAPRLLASHALEGLWAGAPHLVLVSRLPLAEFADEISQIPWAQILRAPYSQVWAHQNPQVGRRVWSHLPIEPLWGAQSVTGAHPIRAFRQVAQTLLHEARARAVKALLEARPTQVVDLYCGTGDLALLLPAQTAWLGIELSGAAVEYANTLRPSGDAHRAFVGTVEHRLADPTVRAQIRDGYALYLNPPRPGLMPAAQEQLAKLFAQRRPLRVVYLSCSASSLARDLRFLGEQGFRVQSLQPFDFFPQTEHFETLAVLDSAKT